MPRIFVEDPDAALDYEWNWASWLAGDTIASYTVTVAPTGDDALALDSHSASTTAVTAWLSGGTAGKTYTVTCHIVTAAGREDDRTISIIVQER